MMTKRWFVVVWMVCVALAGLLVGRAALAEPMAIARLQDPAVAVGSSLPGLLGAPLETLALYAWDGASWRAVPFQVDEVTAAGVFTSTEDGLLDANDQLVFMGADAGQPSTCAQSLALTGGAAHARTALTVADPLSGQTGMLYVYRNLPRSAVRYVSVDNPSQTITGAYNGSHVLTLGGAEPTPFVGVAGIAVNGSADLIDRLKLRIGAQARVQPLCAPIFPLVPFNLDEESLTDFADPTAELPITGPVRAAGGDGALFGVLVYGSRLDIAATIDPVLVEELAIAGGAPICAGSLRLTNLRLSLDQRDPAAGGVVTRYRDSQIAADVTIDGLPDAGLPAPTPWSWATLRDGGAFGGLALTVPQVNPGSGSVANYYVDNAGGGVTGDGTADTGDNRSFGDAGLRIVNSARTVIGFRLVGYVLPPGAPAGGAAYAQTAAQPLTVTAVEETCAAVPTAVHLRSAAAHDAAAVWPLALLLLAGLFALRVARRT